MAVAGDHFRFGSVRTVTTFTLNLLSGKWKRRRMPAPGDLAVVLITEPQSGVTGPAGWTAQPENAFWKVLEPADIGPDIRFTSAAGALKWDAEAWVLEDGTYSLPAEPDACGSAVPDRHR